MNLESNDTHATSNSIPATAVSNWFAEKFSDLHPLIQSLHIYGGELSGPVEIRIGTGLSKVFGTALARQLSVPTTPGLHTLKVDISHGDDGLHWDRCFDGETQMKSLFVPKGSMPDGYWIENTGPARLALTVDIINGGWHWRCLKIWVRGIRVPKWLFPNSTAFKRIEGGRYRFYVGFSLPLMGTVLSYSGLLTATISTTTKNP